MPADRGPVTHPPPGRGRAWVLPGWGTTLDRLAPIGDDLERAGLDVVLHAYAPEGTFDDLGRRLAAAVADAGGHGPLHLVGHSLGGLVCAAAALGPLDGRVTSVTTVNAPWRGTWLGFTGDSPLAEALRWRRQPLRELRARLATHLETPVGPRWHLVGTAGDLGVTAASATLAVGPSGRDRLSRSVVPAVGHSVSLLGGRLRATVVGGLATSGWTPQGA